MISYRFISFIEKIKRLLHVPLVPEDSPFKAGVAVRLVKVHTRSKKSLIGSSHTGILFEDVQVGSSVKFPNPFYNPKDEKSKPYTSATRKKVRAIRQKNGKTFLYTRDSKYEIIIEPATGHPDNK